MKEASRRNKMTAKKNELLKKRQEEGMRWVNFWANYVRTHNNMEWSGIQKIFIDSHIRALQEINMSPKTYLAIKGEKCSRK